MAIAPSAATAHATASPAQLKAFGTLVMFAGMLSAANFILVAAAFIALRKSVTSPSIRTIANILAVMAAALSGYSLFEAVDKGHYVTLGNLLLMADLYYMYDLYDSQQMNFMADGSKTASTLLIWLNMLLAAFAAGSALIVGNMVAAGH